MLSFKDAEVKDAMYSFNEKFKKGGASILWFDKFLGKVMKVEHEAAVSSGKLKYPYEIKIPKSLNELLQGDLEPARIIKINEPAKFGDTPIWWGNSAKGVNLRIGYQNGDSRKPARFSVNDKDIHAILGGITGMGKSVTLNTLIFGIAFEYAPWEVELTLLDAKAADIKRFGESPLPHISAVAATKDTDYILSVLKEKQKEMNLVQSIITSQNCGKLEDFREKTGLCFPQHVIVIDEFQTLFKNAGKKLAELVAIIDDFARLGRSAGYHLVMASQEIGDSVPKATLNQFTVRMCLGATEAVSDQILGNGDSKNIRTKGRLNVNMNPEGHNSSENIEFKVPFQPSDGKSDQFTPQAAFLMQLGEQNNFIRPRSFYDENAIVYEKDYSNYLHKFSGSIDKLYFGEPSFVMRDDEQIVKVEFNRRDFENIMVINNDVKHLIRYGRMLKHNVMDKDCTNIVMNADQNLYEQIGLDEIATIPVDVKSVNDPNYKGVLSTVYNRRLMQEVDNHVKGNPMFHETTDNVIINKFGTSDVYYTRLNRSRAYYIDGLLRTDYKMELGLDGLTGEALDERVDETIIDLLTRYNDYGVSEQLIKPENFPVAYIWVPGFQRIQGLGRDGKTTPQNDFKQVLFDSCLVNIRFIMFATNVDEIAEPLKGVRYLVLDNAPATILSRVKAADFYPTIIPKQLGCLVDMTNKETYKFKKMFLPGELLV